MNDKALYSNERSMLMLNSIMNSPATGDMSWIVAVVLAAAVVAMVVVFIISKKKGD